MVLNMQFNPSRFFHLLLVCISIMWRFAADNHSMLSWMICRARPTAWKPTSALSQGFFLALWPGSIRMRSAGGIFGFPRLVYLPRYSRGGRRGHRLPSPQLARNWKIGTQQKTHEFKFTLPNTSFRTKIGRVWIRGVPLPAPLLWWWCNCVFFVLSKTDGYPD